jgi:hypothetical protein
MWHSCQIGRHVCHRYWELLLQVGETRWWMPMCLMIASAFMILNAEKNVVIMIVREYHIMLPHEKMRLSCTYCVVEVNASVGWLSSFHGFLIKSIAQKLCLKYAGPEGSM